MMMRVHVLSTLHSLQLILIRCIISEYSSSYISEIISPKIFLAFMILKSLKIDITKEEENFNLLKLNIAFLRAYLLLSHSSDRKLVRHNRPE